MKMVVNLHETNVSDNEAFKISLIDPDMVRNNHEFLIETFDPDGKKIDGTEHRLEDLINLYDLLGVTLLANGVPLHGDVEDEDDFGTVFETDGVDSVETFGYDLALTLNSTDSLDENVRDLVRETLDRGKLVSIMVH